MNLCVQVPDGMVFPSILQWGWVSVKIVAGKHSGAFSFIG